MMKLSSGIKTKFYWILALVWLLSIAGILAVMQWAILPSFVELEKQEARNNMDRIRDSINREVDWVELFCRDYAQWDDTYRFMENPADMEKFVTDDLGESTIDAVDLICLIDPEGQVKVTKTFEKNFRTGEKEPIQLGELPADQFPLDHPLLVSRKTFEAEGQDSAIKKGIIKIDERFLLFASSPILDSKGNGPMHGTIIMGNFLDKSLVGKIRTMTHLDFNVVPVAEASTLCPNFRVSEMASQNYQVDLKNKKWVEAFSSIKDMQGKPLFVISARITAGILQKGYQTMGIGLVLQTALLLILILILKKLVDRQIVIPITNLTEHICDTIKTGDLTGRFASERQDEIGELARQYSLLLEELENGRRDMELSSITDGMTGLYNQKHLLQRLNDEIDRSRLQHAALSLVIIDIDHFKVVNDICGHQMGDKVIMVAAAHILAGLAPGDILGRYGGDEFVAVLPGKTDQEAFKTMDNIRRQIEQIKVGNKEVSISISCGLQVWSGQTASQLIAQADNKLYLAKKQGRNRVVFEDKESMIVNHS